VDSIGKKIKVVNEAIQTLGLKNAIGIQKRVEGMHQQFDIAVSRAVTNLPFFISLVSERIRAGNKSGVGNGVIYIKGGDLDEELKNISWNKRVYDLQLIFGEDFFETKKVVHLIK
jgi:16S rRNA (guanine527-N7)-methyltransferase